MQQVQQQSKNQALSFLGRSRKRIIIFLTILAAVSVVYAFIPIPIEDLAGTDVHDKLEVKYTNRFNIWKEIYWDEWVGK